MQLLGGFVKRIQEKHVSTDCSVFACDESLKKMVVIFMDAIFERNARKCNHHLLEFSLVFWDRND